MARCCDAVFLLAETEVAMTSVISSLVKDKNYCIFMGYQILPLEKSCYFIGVLVIKKYYQLALMSQLKLYVQFKK